MKRISILGAGAYGLALALMFNKKTSDIRVWTKFDYEVEELTKTRENKKVLPGVKIPKNISFTTNMKEAVEGADLIVCAVPASFVDNIAEELQEHIKPRQHICIASKGIEQDSCSFVVDILRRYIQTKKVAVISGPSFAVDIASNCPIGLSLATTNKQTAKLVKETLENEFLKLRITRDVVGVEICGSIKNVIAIAAGMLSGLGYPESTQAMFITESLHDIKNLIKAFGGNKNTILSFAGFGDLLLTATSIKSRNFQLGYLIGSKASQSKIDNYIKNTTIEGLYTLKSIYKLLNRKKVKMPIIDLIYNIIYRSYDPNELARFLIEKE